VHCSDLAGSAIRGQNMHWELLTTQAVFCVRAGSFVQVRCCFVLLRLLLCCYASVVAYGTRRTTVACCAVCQDIIVSGVAYCFTTLNEWPDGCLFTATNNTWRVLVLLRHLLWLSLWIGVLPSHSTNLTTTGLPRHARVPRVAGQVQRPEQARPADEGDRAPHSAQRGTGTITVAVTAVAVLFGAVVSRDGCCVISISNSKCYRCRTGLLLCVW
jgi:hypothetical protein